MARELHNPDDGPSDDDDDDKRYQPKPPASVANVKLKGLSIDGERRRKALGTEFGRPHL